MYHPIRTVWIFYCFYQKLFLLKFTKIQGILIILWSRISIFGQYFSHVLIRESTHPKSLFLFLMNTSRILNSKIPPLYNLSRRTISNFDFDHSSAMSLMQLLRNIKNFWFFWLLRFEFGLTSSKVVMIMLFCIIE